MKFSFKVVILFLILFNFRVPGLYNSAFLAMLLCTFYYFNNQRSIPLTYFFQRYSAVILIATIVLAFIIILIPFLHEVGDVVQSREKRTLIELMMLGATVYVMPLLVEGKESAAFEEIALIICYAFALQGALDLAAVLYDPLGDLFIKLKPGDALLLDADDPDFGNRFRFCNLSGTRLVELTASFGVSFIVFFMVQTKYDHPLMSGLKKYFVFLFILLGTMFAGRTGFIGLVMGFAGWLFFSFNRILLFFKRNMKYIVGFTSLLLFVFYVVLPPKQRQTFTDGVFPFAFEWYYNYKDQGKFEVGSADAIPDHYFFLYDKTLLAGHGVDAFGAAALGYPHSDAGYMNTLVYGGIPFLLILIIYQLLYFVRPIEAALNNKLARDWISIGFFILLIAYIFIAEIKASMVAYLHVIEVMYLALGSSYMIQYYTQKEQDESTG